MAKTQAKKSVNVICENCDSEYTLKYMKVQVAGNPVWCAFCGEEIEDLRDDEEDEELEGYRSDDDE